MSSRSSSSNRSSRSTRKSDTSLRIVLGRKGVKSNDDTVDLTDNDTENGEVEEITDSENSSVDGAKAKKTTSKDKDKERSKSIVLSPDIGQLINRILCCSCGKQLNHTNPGAVRRHPWLKVVTCKKCYKFLKSGPFTRDNDGIDEQCRWCGDGGRLYGCDYCHNCFCRSCIKRNLGRSEAARMENEDDSKWHCYLCKPKKIKKLVDDCDQIMAYIDKEEEKEKERERKAKLREKEKKEKEEKEKKEKEEVKIKEETEKEKKMTLPAPKSKNEVLMIENSPQKPEIKTLKTEGEKSSTKIDVKMIQKVGNTVKEKIIGPRVSQLVSTAQVYKVQPVIQPARGPQTVAPMKQQHGRVIAPNTSNLAKMLTSNNIGGSKAPVNDIKALQDAIFPYNVENILEKMNTVAQSLSLTLNSIKTDLAIAKLASSNMFQAKNSAAALMKNGMGSFFANVREIFNVQLVASTPPIEIDSVVQDTKNTSTPMKGVDIVKTKEDPNVSAIPIDLDESDVGSEVDSKKNGKTEKTNIADKKEPEEKKEEVKENGDCGSVGDGAEVDEDYVIMEIEDDDDDDESEEDKINDQSQKDQKVKNKASENDKVVDKTENGEGKVTDKIDNKDDKVSKDLVNESEDDGEKSNKQGDKRKKVKDIENTKDKDSEATVEEADSEDKTEDNEDEDVAAKDSDTDKPGRTGVLDESENTAAELELLKEMADEINEKEKKSSQSDDAEPRRSSRVKPKKDENEETSNKRTASRSPMKSSKVDEGDSENEQESKRSKRRQASKGKEKERDKTETGSETEEETVTRRSSRNASAKKTEKDKSENADSDNEETETEKRRSRNKQKTDSEKSSNRSKSSDSKKKGSEKSKSNLQMKMVSSDSDTEEGNKVPEIEPVIGSGVDEDISSGDESDDSDSSDEETPAFGKRKKKKKVGSHLKKTAAEKEETLRKKVKRRMGKKKAKSGKDGDKKGDDDDDDAGSDSSNYDPELEKEIQSLSKDTKLSRKAKKEARTKLTDKKEKQTSVKKKKGKKVDDIEDLSSGTDEEKPAEEEEEDDDEENKDIDTDDLSPSQIRKLKNAQKEAAEEDSEFEPMQADDSDNSTDHEVSFPKLGAQKGKKKLEEDLSEDSDFAPSKKKRVKDKLLDAKISDSDSDLNKKGKKGKKRKRKEDKSESEQDPEDETNSDDGKKKKKGKGKRRRIKKISSSEDEALKEPGADDDVGDSDDEEGQGGYMKRKKIRKVMGNKKLGDETKAARKAEDERRKRIEDRQKEYNSYVEVEGGEEDDDIPEGTEREEAEDSISKILGSPRKVPVTTKCILEMDKDKKPLVEIDRTLVKKLKPHQVEAVRFMFNCLVENVARLEKEEGSGAILAHCMGLGKTLSVISFVHTMLRSYKQTKMKHCLVVCPLNTVLNWVNEFEVWLDDIDFEIDVYEMSRVKQNFERAQMLKEWMEGGAGVMIIGYDMYRNLVNGSHCKNKKQKKIFVEALAEPGPDLVVCDEGHILKNDQTSLSKSMMKIKSKRRVVLTGTPLQNNLNEYHCMANFVKPNLLGTRKEFSNRFANPITNGQCSDSTPQDVRLMKRRAHILHEMLAGCVQRKDYSALTKFLPPKFEYVISVRLHPLQMTLYEKYLECSRGPSVNGQEAAYKGARMFRDYQALMRIWTHPWVLKLDEIRQENKRQYDESEDSFVDDNSYDEEDSFISDETSESESDSDYKKKKKKSKSKKGKKRGGRSSASSSEEEVQKDEDKNEVVKKWTSRRRGNEEGAGSSWMEDWGYAAEGPKEVSSEWWAEFVKEEDEYKLELSGKLILLFEILRMCEDIGDKVLVFSQSLLSLDIIEDFLAKMDEQHSSKPADTANKDAKTDKPTEEKKVDDKKKEDKVNGEKEGMTEKDQSADKNEESAEKKEEKYAQYCQSWVKGADYFRMDGSTSSIHRKAAQDMFNDPENYRARLFLISTKAGSLGINLVSANRVIIFDASWNPSHDIQSIFRVYRFGQTKPVYVYRFLAQGTMEEKIYERQVTKQSLAQRVVDEHQIDRHFTNADLQELYYFTPDRLDDPNRKEKPLPMLPKDHMLAELMTSKKEWIVTFHEHDSLLENKAEQELSEEEKKAAWEDYENEKKGRPMYGTYGNQSMYANPNMDLQNLMLHGQANLGQAAVLQIVQDLKARFPNLPPEIFQQRVQAVLRQVLTQQIMRQSEMQRRQIDQQKMNELNRLNQIKQQIQRQQAMLSNQQQGLGMGSSYAMGSNAASSMMYANPMMQYGSGGQGASASLIAMNRQLQNMQNNQPGSGSGGGSGASGTGR